MMNAVAAVESTKQGVFRVRSVPNHQEHRELQDPFLTFSDDGAEREDEFFLDMYDTPGVLTDSGSPNAIQTAMNFFLLSELGEYFTSYESVRAVESEILTLGERNDTFLNSDGQNTTRTGTEVRMRIYLTFEQKPSPDSEQVISIMKTVMSNMTYFVTNLTSSLVGEQELSGVYEAIRREIATAPGLIVPPNTTEAEIKKDPETGGQTQIQINTDDTTNIMTATVPVILVVAVLVALVVFFVFRRRAKSEPESPKNSAILYMDVENELYSMDRSVETSQSPKDMLSPLDEGSNSIQYSMSDDEESQSHIGDSVFSGVETEYRNVRASKSAMTGYTESTIRVSNVDRKQKVATPKSYGGNSSLFAFSEEVDGVRDDDEDDRDDRDHGLLGGAPSLTRSDLSDTDDELLFSENEREQPSKVGKRSSGTPSSAANHGNEEARDSDVDSSAAWCAGSSTDVLVDLADLEHSETRRDPTPSIARAVGSTAREPTPSAQVSYNVFNCAEPDLQDSQDEVSPIIPAVTVVLANEALESKNKGSTPKTSVVQNLAVESKNKVSTPKSSAVQNANTPPAETVDSTMPTPLLKNGGNKGQSNQNEASSKPAGRLSGKATSIMTGIFRSNRKSASNPSTPQKPSSSQNEGSFSAPSSPNKQVGGHWFTLSNNNKWRPPKSPKLVGNDDYEMNLSRPSTPGDDTEVSDYGKEDSYGYAEEDETSDVEGHHGGRRHVGDTIGGDGSAMYQTNAMHPLDWSYKSGDAGSVGESTISENEQLTTNERTQYIFKKGNSQTIKLGESLQSIDLMENSKTPKSEATKESVASASRQLINDLVWLEKKIAGVKHTPGIEATDSLSYVSNDNDEFRSVASRDSQDEEAPTVSTGQNNSVMSSIVCRDCYAPPGKLNIVIHSTKDGPAVHTVKEGSSLEGHIFPGDLIISVDNVDTRSYTAEEVMKMMASKSDQERKITVLHFEEEE